MTPHDIERIAKGLTKAQAEVVEVARLEGGDWCLTYKCGASTVRALQHRGLVRLRTGIPDCLTPVGLSVRQYILEQEQKHG